MLSWTFQAFMYFQKFNGCIQQGINNVGRGTIHLSDRSAPERGGSVEKSKNRFFFQGFHDFLFGILKRVFFFVVS